MSQSSSRPPSEANNRDGRDGLKFEEKLRLCRERQEDERQRRLQDIEISIQQKGRYRTQVEDERRRKIDELKVKDLEKRSAVEERKKLIWEAEQERKEAMVRRSMDRDNKLEAKRLAQRNNTSFVFGSSTPRTLDLDLPSLGGSRQTLLFATPNRPADENQHNSRRRPISAYYSDDFHNADIMSQSLVSLQAQAMAARGRVHHTELTPALPRERIFASSTGRISRDAANRSMASSMIDTPIRSTGPKRAVSMTRLDQLAQPRRRYLDDSLKSNNSLISGSPDVMPPPQETVKRRAKPTVPRKPRPLSIGSPYAVKMKVEDKVEPKQDSIHERTPFSARGGRSHDKQAPQTTPTSAAVHMRPNRTRSAGGQPRPMSLISPDSYEHHMATTGGAPKPTPPRKPAHVKAAAMARKANKSVDSPVPPQTPPQTDSPTADHSVSFAKCKPNNSNNNNNSSDGIVKQNSADSTVVPSIEPKSAPNEAAVSTVAPTATNGSATPCDTPPQTPSGKKEVSEEDYKKMMAEKRRLAREQAEREAEQERQRLLEEQREEEERQRREEEEQRRLEEEQLRLIEIQRRAEEERLQKAMEENRLREEEEAKRRAEEQRIRSEKEEKERRAKDEADQQRRELEERLKRDEAERIARKKKLEAIMSRTRKPPTPTAPRVDSSTPPAHSPNETPEPPVNEHSNHSTPEKSREVAKNHQNLMKNEDLVIITTATPDLVVDADRAVLNNRQNNGSNGGVSGGQTPHNGSHQYNINNNNHIESFSVSGDLLGMGSAANPSLDQLIHINYSTPNTRTDDLNSNNPFANGNGFTNGGAGHKSQEQTAITDLLS